MKLKFEMTPNRRMDATFWLGTCQAIASMTILHDMSSDDPIGLFFQGVLVVAWFIFGFLYVKNNIAFRKETLWMTIKNPAKVTREEGDLMTKRPMRPPPMGGLKPPPPPPPPPPRPPNGRQIKEGEQPKKPHYTYKPGSWPPKKP